ncbi:Ig domain-containing protein [Streptomyces sp. NPDC101490]|uniref:Ig domain-containing protein n=1 Tax=Streptomyces sp. NPDC101490 TaxID=3366143 RepID=UPI00382D47C6
MMPAPAGQAPAAVPAQPPSLQAVNFGINRDIADDPLVGTGYNVTYLRNETPTALVEVQGLDGLTGISLMATDGTNFLGTSMPQNPVAGMMIFDVPLTALPGAGTVGNTSPMIDWVLVDANNTMVPLHQTMHTFYRLFDNPTTGMRMDAVHEATTMAGGQNDGQGVATALRGAIKARVPYNGAQLLCPDPLALLSSAPAGAVCSDFANLHIMLAQTLGLQANAVMFWGGFQHGGHSVWASDAATANTLTNVRATDPANNPGGGQQGWDFTYHAIANIGGTLHDAALNREGYAAEAIHEGLLVFLPELLPTPATPFAATTQSAFSASLAADFALETVGVTRRQHGDQITNADFAANVLNIMPIPPGTQAAHQDPVQLTGGALPPGLVLDPDGTLAGTPTTPGHYAFTVSSSLNTPVTYSLVVS